jgi:hypothetical protein
MPLGGTRGGATATKLATTTPTSAASMSLGAAADKKPSLSSSSLVAAAAGDLFDNDAAIGGDDNFFDDWRADGSDDDLLQRFIVTGYVVLPPNPSVPASAHADIASSVLACGFQASGRRTPYGLAMLDGDAAGNNLLHAAPALRGEPCLASPALHSALRVLLGRGYRLHPHCRAHLRERGAKSTMWHVDAYKGTSWSSGRQHEPHWLMIMYYPQATSLSMGPTELLPGSQYYRGDSDREHYSRGHIPDFSEQMAAWAPVPHALTCAAGTIVVMHYDLWHRALESHSMQPRLMLKFIACRTEPPPAYLCSPFSPPSGVVMVPGACAAGRQLP